MFLEEKQKAILDYLDNHEKATVQYFSTIFRVSKETIRKDLSSLSEQNLIVRCHGGAIILRQKFVSNVTSKENITSLLTKYKKQKIKNRGEKMNGNICIGS